MSGTGEGVESVRAIEDARIRGSHFCRVCRGWKSAAHFGRDARVVGGRSTRCRACAKAAALEREELRVARRSAELAAARACILEPGAYSCVDCDGRGVFVVPDGARVCAQCLKARARARRG